MSCYREFRSQYLSVLGHKNNKSYVCVRNVPLGNRPRGYVVRGSERVLAEASSKSTGSP